MIIIKKVIKKMSIKCTEKDQNFDCEACEQGETSYGTNGFGEVENVLLHPCGKISEI